MATQSANAHYVSPAEDSEEHRQEMLTVMNAWRLKTLNTVLTIVAALGSISIVALFAGGLADTRQLPTEFIFLGTYLAVLGLAFYRRLDWRIRGWGFLIIAYLVGIMALARGGLAGTGREYLIIIPVLATILIGIRAGMATATLSLAIMVAFSFIADAGDLHNLLIYEQNPVDLASWAEEIAYTVVLMFIGTSLLILFNRYLLRMLTAERGASHELELARARLEEYSQTLEEKVDQRTAELAQANEVVAQANKRMEQELAFAGNIQASFMSNELPRIAGWQRTASLVPARQTSGDFYDIYPLGQHRYGVFVADVVDKGVGAALFMALCWGLVHTYASEHPDRPDLVMKHVNDRLFRDSHSGQFVTLFYGVLDTIRCEMIYCNAGHNPPFRFGADQARPVQSLTHTGIPLGIFQDRTWEVRTIQFQRGDLLVLYSDGVTEVENAQHEFFGSDRLVSVVEENLGKSAQEVHDIVVHSLNEFAGGRPQCDDITLMVLVCGRMSSRE